MTIFSVGQAVKVSDKRPKPPKHHSKKLKEWERNHFNGVIKEIRAYKGCMLVENIDTSRPGVIEICFEISFSDPIRKVESIKTDREE